MDDRVRMEKAWKKKNLNNERGKRTALIYSGAATVNLALAKVNTM